MRPHTRRVATMSGDGIPPISDSETLNGACFLIETVPWEGPALRQDGQGVEIVLRPFLERMMVALGALQANAEKSLADGARHLFRTG